MNFKDLEEYLELFFGMKLKRIEVEVFKKCSLCFVFKEDIFRFKIRKEMGEVIFFVVDYI